MQMAHSLEYLCTLGILLTQEFFFCYAWYGATGDDSPETYRNKRLYNTLGPVHERETSNISMRRPIFYHIFHVVPKEINKSSNNYPLDFLYISRVMSSSSVAPPMIGALPPPPGVTPNFMNPYSIGDGLKAAGILFVVLTTLSTAIRLYTKFLIIKTHGWEDCKLKRKKKNPTPLWAVKHFWF